MRKNIFSDDEKNMLAGLKTIYQHNQQLVGGLHTYSLQAAEALWSLADLFLKAIPQVETEKELNDVIRRFQEATLIEVNLSSTRLQEKKTELLSLVTNVKIQSRNKVKRLRKKD